MLYQRLYDHVQSLPLHIGRDLIRDKVLGLVGIDRSKFLFARTTFDISACRGMFIAPGHSNHYLASYGHVIAIARGLNRCWERFVYIKELMHLLDGQNGATDSGNEFEQVLMQLTGPTALKLTPQTQAEVEAFWKALGVLCPEQTRLSFKEDRAKQHISDYDIALRLRIPELYVPRLFSPTYEQVILSGVATVASSQPMSG